MDAARSIPSTHTRSFRVLIVDDNAMDTELTAGQLGSAWPFEGEMAVDSAASGREAIEKLREHHFALLILDWQMSPLNGGDVLRYLRKNGVCVPVVVLSGLQRHEIGDNLESYSAAFLNKDNLNQKTLHTAIAQSLRLLGRLPSA